MADQDLADMMSDMMSDMMAEMMAESMLADRLGVGNGIEYYRDVVFQINDCIKTRRWSEIQPLFVILINSEYFQTDEIAHLVKLIEFGEKEWNTLKCQGKANHIYIALRIVHLITAKGDRGTIVKLMQHDGVKILVKMYKSIACEEKMFYISIILMKMITKHINDGSIVKEIAPIIPRAVHNMKQKGVLKNWKVVYGLIVLTYESIEAGTEEEVRMLLDLGVVSVLASALKVIEKLDKTEYLESWKCIITAFKTITDKKGNPDDIYPVIPGILKTLSNYRFTGQLCSNILLCLCGSNCLITFIIKGGEKKHIEAIIKANFIPTMVNIIKDMRLFLKTMNIGLTLDVVNQVSVYQSTIRSTVESLARIVSEDPNTLINMVGEMLPLVPCVTSDMSTVSKDDVMPQYAIRLFGYMALVGAVANVRTMLKHGLVRAILKVLEAHPDELNVTKCIVTTLYYIVIKVDDDIYLTQELLPYMGSFIMYFKRWEGLVEYKDVLNRAAYIAVAMADFANDRDPQLSQAVLDKMSLFFHEMYKTIRSVKRINTGIQKGIATFMVNRMFKYKMFQPTVLHQAWFILKHGEEDQIEELAQAINALRVTDGCSNQNSSKDEKTSQIEHKAASVLKFVQSKTKDIIEEQDKYTIIDLIRITQFVVDISCEDGHDDQTVFWLEDMVSPCLGVLQNRENETVIKNIKHFINNLHY